MRLRHATFAMALLISGCDRMEPEEPAGCTLLLDSDDPSAQPCDVERVFLTIGDNQPRLFAADMDGDTRPDLLLAGDILEFYRFDGGPPAALARKTIALPEGWGPEAWSAPAHGDIDGDGDEDLFARPWTVLTATSVVPGTGDGSFGEPVPLLPAIDGDLGPAPFRGFEQVGLGDVDGDGRNDLLGFYGASYFTFARGTAGGFEPPEVWYQPVDPAELGICDNLHFEVADLNGDGRSDAVVGAHGRLVSLLGNENGFETVESAGIADPAQMQNVEALADFDGDGRLDALVMPTNADGYPFKKLFLHRGDGTGRFLPWQAIDVPGGITLHVADFDGDGRAEIFYGALRNQVRAVGWKGDRWETVFAATGRDDSFLRVVQEIAVADFDGDGDADVAWLTHLPDDYQHSTLEVVFVSRSSAAPAP